MRGDLTAEQIEAARRAIPIGRLGRPEDIAETIAFLASARAGYITGAELARQVKIAISALPKTLGSSSVPTFRITAGKPGRARRQMRAARGHARGGSRSKIGTPSAIRWKGCLSNAVIEANGVRQPP